MSLIFTSGRRQPHQVPRLSFIAWCGLGCPVMLRARAVGGAVTLPVRLQRGQILGTKNLLERDTELAVISDAAMAAVHARTGATLLIEGPAGIGKTSLLEAGYGIAAGLGAPVLRARGGELERDFSFGVARQLLEARVSALAVAERERVLDGAARSAAPVVDPRVAAGPVPADEAAAEERAFMVSHGLFWLVCNLADTVPLFLGVDDGQWCDAGSARFLSYLSRRLDELPVLLVVAMRSGEPGNDAVRAALGGSHTRVLRPRPLSVAATGEVVRRKLASGAEEDFCRECHRVSGGNPFLLGALLDELAAERIAPVSASAGHLAGVHPPTVTRGILARLARLGPDAGSLARAVAVLDSAELREAASLANLDVPAAARAADALADAEVLSRQRRLEFAHPLVRNVVYESIAPAQRALEHGRAAWLFSQPAPDYDRMACHLLQAAPAADRRVVDVLREAARLALRHGATDAAVAHLRRALREPPQPSQLPDVTRELGTAELLAREPSAIERLTDALAITAQPVQRAQIALLLGRALVTAGRLTEAESVLSSPISELGSDGDLAVRLEMWRAALGLLDPRFRAGLDQRLPVLRSLAGRSGPAGQGLLVVLAYLAAMKGADREEVLGLTDQGLDGARFLTAETDGMALWCATLMLAWIDDLDRADRVRDELLAAARHGSVVASAIAAICAASTAMRRGSLAVAEAEARTAADLAVQYDRPFYEPFARALLGEALLERGDIGQAAAAMDGIDLEHIRGSGPSSLLLHVRGRVRAARGDREGAARDLRRCGEISELLGYVNPNIAPWRSCLAQVVPDPQEAQALVQTELSRARRAGQPRGIGVALRVTALLSHPRERLPLLQEAVETLRRSPSALELARALSDYGSALARGGQRTTAREPLRQAMDLADRCGARGLARHARDELRATGARPRRERLSGLDSLTPGELSVARLAADGLTNRQIAEALFVSTKTVGTHLGHIYDKLAVNNREAIARIMQEGSRAPR
jgi:DNA-binding CsgD family transcriptional regulator